MQKILIKLTHNFQNIIFATLFLSIVFACSSSDDSTSIRDMVKKGAELAESHRIGKLINLTSKDFIAQPGHHNARAVKGILFRAFQYYGDFNIFYPRPSISVGDDGITASATIYFVILRQNLSLPGLKKLYDNPQQWVEAVGEKADLYQLKLQLSKTDGDWQVKGAHLKPFKGFGF